MGGGTAGRMLDEGSVAVGETAELPKPGLGLVGDVACEGGVGRDLGEVTACRPWMDGATEAAPGSSLGAMLEADLREWWCLFRMALWMGGGCTMFWGI